MVDSVSAARVASAEGMPEAGWTIVSLHHSVVDHFAVSGVQCIDISSFSSVEDCTEEQAYYSPGGSGYEVYTRLLASLDTVTTKLFFEELGVAPFPLLSSCYGYYLYWQLIGLGVMRRIVHRLLDEEGCRRITVYTSPHPLQYFTMVDFVQIPSELPGHVEVDVRRIDNFAPTPLQATHNFTSKSAWRCFLDLFYYAAWKRRKFLPYKGPTLLVSEPVYDLMALARHWCGFKVMYQSELERPELGRNPALENKVLRAKMQLCFPDDATSSSSGEASCARKLTDMFAANASDWLYALLELDALVHEGKIQGMAFGNTPQEDRGILAAYLHAQNVPTVVLQHGVHYGIVEHSWPHYLSDYLRCSHFFSYGWGADTLKEEEGMPSPCRVVPVGCVGVESVSRHLPLPCRPTVAFPITNCTDWLGGRLPAALLASYQRAILEELSRLERMDIWVKPFSRSTDSDFAWQNLLHSLGKLRIASGGWRDFLERTPLNLVIIEYPSSPLFEALQYDVDIFTLLDPVWSFKPEALALLRKRCHVFDTVEDLTKAIREYRPGAGPKLRDDEFLKKYIFMPDASRNMVRELTRILRGQQKPKDGRCGR